MSAFPEIITQAMKLLKAIEKLGDYSALIVGGAPRDLLLGEEINDIDIATNCPVNVLQEKFQTYELGRSSEFGTFIVTFNDTPYEVTQFRSDGDYADGRHPENVEIVKGFSEDVKRRDFTINALGLNSKGIVIDHLSGLRDLEDRLVKAIGNPIDRFTEDHLRLIRAARFASRNGFALHPATRQAARRNAHLIEGVTPDRIRLELMKAADRNGEEFARFILLLKDLRILHRILPEVSALEYFRHDLTYHPEGAGVLEHVIECLKGTNDMEPISKIAVLLHDIGKAICFQEKHQWKMSYHGHEHASVTLARDVLERLHFSTWHTDAVLFAIENHMKFKDILEMRASKIASIVNNEHYDTLVDVCEADEFSRGETYMSKGEFEQIIKRASSVRDHWISGLKAQSNKHMIGGDLVMQVTGLKPGRMVGLVQKRAEAMILDFGINPADSVQVENAIKDAFVEISR